MVAIMVFEMFNIDNGMDIVDLSLKVNDYLIVSDLHLGYEESLNRSGVMLPKFQYAKIVSRLKDIVGVCGASKIIVNGDLKHEFGIINRQEKREVYDFIDFLNCVFNEVYFVKGNHDNLVPYIRDVELLDSISIDDCLVLHGHIVPEDIREREESKIVIGHEHPCIGLRNGERVEKIKCFLKGPFLEKELVVVPSFNFISEGSDILYDKLLSPFLNDQLIGDFNVYCVEDFEVFDFGKIKDINRVNESFI